MKCHCNNKCLNVYNVSKNEMVYSCKTLEFNMICNSNQDWSNIKFARNKHTNCKFKKIVSYNKKPICHKKKIKKSKKIINNKINNESKFNELKIIFDLWNNNYVVHSYSNAMRIKIITDQLGWNSKEFDINMGMNKYKQKIYEFDWISYMTYVEKCLYISLAISKHIGFRTIKPIKYRKRNIQKFEDLYGDNTSQGYKPIISKQHLEHIKNLRHRMKMKAHQNYS